MNPYKGMAEMSSFDGAKLSQLLCAPKVYGKSKTTMFLIYYVDINVQGMPFEYQIT